VDHQHADLVFRINAREGIPVDHAYPLYSALKAQWERLGDSDGLGVFPIRGDLVGRRIHLRQGSRLRLRTPVSRLSELITLTGKTLRVAGAHIQVGIPSVLPLRPASSLQARMVQIKLADAADGISPQAFLHSARKQLEAMGIEAEAGIPLHKSGRRAGQPRRRVLQIKGEKHVGFALRVEGLTADESLRLQTHGLGGRRKMGCGLFMPVRGAR